MNILILITKRKMKVYSTTYFRRNLAKCLTEATEETVFIIRPGNTMIQLIIVPQQDVNKILKQWKH